jgi:hypothetical protein
VVLYIRWADLASMSLSEWGHFIAEVAAALAFIWLVVGYFLQRQELRLNTAALRTQEEELERSTSEAKELVKQTVRTAEAIKELARATAEQVEQRRVSARSVNPSVFP